jgi:hypothetical protein
MSSLLLWLLVSLRFHFLAIKGHIAFPNWRWPT